MSDIYAVVIFSVIILVALILFIPLFFDFFSNRK